MTGSARMNRRLVIQRAVTTPNGFNEPVETWETLATVWCDRKDVSAAEMYRAQEVGATITTRFTIRYSAATADVNPRDRISFDGIFYNIAGVREKQRGRWMEIDCFARQDIAAQEVDVSP